MTFGTCFVGREAGIRTVVPEIVAAFAIHVLPFHVNGMAEPERLFNVFEEQTGDDSPSNYASGQEADG